MHFRVDITPYVPKVLTAAAAVGVLDIVWFCVARQLVYSSVKPKGSRWYVPFIYLLVGWALAMVESDPACESHENYNRLIASWGSFVGLLVWGVFNLTYGFINDQWSLKTMGVDTLWGVMNCLFSILFLSAVKSW